MFSPGDNINVTFPSDSQVVVNGNKLTLGEVGYCVAAAVGADSIWAIGASTTATWGAASSTRLFTKTASRFLGPVGVAIAVASFGICIANELND